MSDDDFSRANEIMRQYDAEHSGTNRRVSTEDRIGDWRLESAASIAARGVEEPLYDIDTLLPADDGPAIMFGPPAALKSWIALHATACIASGNPFLGHFAVRRRPFGIYINLDAGARAFERRIVKAGIDASNLLITSPASFNVDSLRGVFSDYAGAFIVIDTFADAFVCDRRDDQAQVMRTFLRELRGLYAEFGCNGIIVDHPRRAREGEAGIAYYGSIQKEATARTMWSAQRIPSCDKLTARVKICCQKMSEGEPFAPFVATFRFAQLVTATYDGFLDEVSGAVANGPSDMEIVEGVLQGADGGVTREVLSARSGLARDRVLAAVKRSLHIKVIGLGKATRYQLTQSSVPSEDSSYDSGTGGLNRSYRPQP